MTALAIYLIIGAIIGFVVVVVANNKPIPAFVYAATMLALIVLWPVCLAGGYLQRRGRRSR